MVQWLIAGLLYFALDGTLMFNKTMAYILTIKVLFIEREHICMLTMNEGKTQFC